MLSPLLFTSAPESSTKARRPTSRDVAERAGVDRSVVSVVLNGAKSSLRVSDEKRERVLLAASELGYRPNLAARSIKSGRSRQVGVLVRNNSRRENVEKRAHPLAYDMVLGISEGLEEAGYMMNFVRLSDVDLEKHTQTSAFQGHLLDGLIVISSVPAASSEHLEELVPRCVWLDGNVWTPENCVRRDERHAGETAAREMATLGYRKWILLLPQGIEQEDAHYSGPQRLAGIQAVAQECGASCQSIVCSNEAARFRELLPLLQPDVAVIALSVYTAHKLLYALHSTLNVGEDFALCCCDDATNSMGWEQLSRVSFDRFALGQCAAQMMIQRLDKTDFPAPSQLVRGEWLRGNTTRPCPQI